MLRYKLLPEAAEGRDYRVTWYLKVSDLTVMFGDGCGSCRLYTGPAQRTNRCPSCNSVVACADVSFELHPGEVLGIVGESGSGKTSLLRALYLEIPPMTGEVYFKPHEGGRSNILQCDGPVRHLIQTQLIGMVYQNPPDGLDFTISSGGNVAERLIAAGWRNVEEIRSRTKQILERIEVPVDRLDDFPDILSGGMQQRVQIAKSIANNPHLLLLDEISTGLDLSVQARVLDMVKDVVRELNLATIVVSHDLRVIQLLADRTMVMHFGRMIEAGLTDQILEDPREEYTQLLVSSMLGLI